MIPTRRDLNFSLPQEEVLNWHAEGIYLSNFYNTLSVFFPEGERFFIHAVRQYRDKITDPNLKLAVTAFIGQEAMHTREHAHYNTLLAQAGLPVVRQEHYVKKMLARITKRLPSAAKLSITIALEHFTAILASRVLKDARLTAGSPVFERIWRWHALETIAGLA